MVEVKTILEWVIVPLLVVLVWAPWGTLIKWAKQEIKKPGKYVV
jgi:hypothetical protein